MPALPEPSEVAIDATSATAFVQQLRDLRIWAGRPSLRNLQLVAGDIRLLTGECISALPRSTVSSVLRGDKLPRSEFVSAFVGACYRYHRRPAAEVDEAVQRWLTAWCRLSAAEEAGQAREPQLPGAADDEVTPGTATPPPAPRQLPLTHGLLVGRDAEIDELDRFMAREAAGQVMVVSGAAGVGKTAVALHAAHERAERFPDGQLYLDLRDTSTGRPIQAHQALGSLLESVGVSPPQIPPDDNSRSRLFRSLVADRAMLLVLDNASTARQVRPLLLTGTSCHTLVTSRSRMPGLMVREGARRLLLRTLSPASAYRVLTSIIEPERTAGAEEALRDLATMCGYLPLALRIAAVNLADRPHQSVQDYVEHFRAGDRLGMLCIPDDEVHGVRSAIDISYEALDQELQQFFRQLSHVQRGEFTLESTATSTGTTRQEAHRSLIRLVQEHLVEPVGTDRFSLNCLLQAYAAEKAARERPASPANGLNRNAWLPRQRDGHQRNKLREDNRQGRHTEPTTH